MQNIYRETFEQIHASEQLRKEVANVPKQEKAAFRHHISKAGLIAAALALALAGTVLAVASPTLWWWFEQKWEEETGSSMTESQSLVIDGLTRKVGERYQRGRDRHCGQYHRGQQSDLGIAGRDGLGL